MDVGMLSSKLQIPRSNNYSEVKLRFVLAPERVEEVIDPVMLDDKQLQREVYGIGHAAGVDLLSYEKPKESSASTDTFVIIQQGKGRGNQVGSEDVRIEITTRGIITIDCDITGQREAQNNRRSMSAFSFLLESDVVEGLNKCFGFAKAFFDWKDPYLRFDRFLYNSVLSNIGYRPLLTEPPKGNSMTMRMENDQPVIAFDDFRTITRNDLSNYESQVTATLKLFGRRLKSPY